MIELNEALQRPYDDSEIDIREAYPLMDDIAAREGWNDPEMDSYTPEEINEWPSRRDGSRSPDAGRE
jgi:hypothetical protein